MGGVAVLADERDDHRPLRLVVVQRFLPHYRLDLFERLHRTLTRRGGELRLFFSFTMGQVRERPAWATEIRGLRADLQLGELEESAVVAPWIVWHLARAAPDVVIVEDLSGLPNSLLSAIYCRRARVPYLVWGLGQVPHKQRSKLRTVLSPAIHYLYRGAAGFIGYSSHAASVYKRYGKPTFVAPNSFLPAPNEAQLASRRASIASRASVAGRLQVLTIGTLKAQKRYAVLLQAVAKSRIDFHLHVVGDGPERPQLERMAADLGIAGRVTFHGALYSAEEKASLLQAADVGVIPGRGGLAIQEMMAYGVPVISGVADGTERDLVADGRSGYLVDGFPSVDDISRRLTHFSSLSGDARHAMSLAALDVVVHESNTELMAQRMAAAAAQVRTR